MLQVSVSCDLLPILPEDGEPMAGHRFKVGQMVFYHPRATVIAAPISRPYQIAARLPSPDGEPQYRIRSPYEEHERAASESELRAV